MRVTSLIYAFFVVTLLPLSDVTAQANQEDAQSIYRIYLGTVSDESELERYEPLKELGFFETRVIDPRTTFSQKPGMRVYLASYLGKNAATAVLLHIWSKGFPDAYLEKDESTFRSDESHQLRYSLQLGAFSKLNVVPFLPYQHELVYGTFIMQENGMYKILGGLYSENELNSVETEIIPHMKKLGFDPFVKKIR